MRFSVNASHSSPGLDRLPCVHDQDQGLVFQNRSRLSIARTVRICASSNAATSTLCNPRPKPFRGAEHDAAAGREHDLLFAVRLRMRSTYGRALDCASIWHISRECLVAGARIVGGPDRFQVRHEYRLEERRGADGEGLADLPAARTAQRSSAPHAYLPSAFLANRTTRSPAAAGRNDAGLARGFVDSRELAANDAFRLSEDLRDFDQMITSTSSVTSSSSSSNRWIRDLRPGVIRCVRIRR